MNAKASTLRRTFATALVAGAAASGGCDLVQGFQDAGDALFPEERTHLNAPGLRLVEGNYRDIRFASGTDLYLLARSPDDPDRRLHGMLFSSPRPCSIPRVAGYMTSHLGEITAPGIAYFEEDVWVGSLRFADARCTVYPHVLDDSRPIDGTPEGFVVWSGRSLRIFNPVTGHERSLSTEADGIVIRAFAGHHLVYAGGSLEVFAPDWRPLGDFGQNVIRVERAGGSLFYEDDTGIRRLSTQRAGITDSLLAGDGCELASRRDPWVHYFAPCAERKLVVFYEPLSKPAALEIDAHPRHVALRPAFGSQGTDPSTQPFWLFYLRDPSPETDLGTLIARGPDGTEHELGRQAALELLDLVETPESVYGHALVDVTGNTGTYRYWTPEGERVDLATGTLREGDRVIVDFDGAVGKLAAVSKDQLSIVAENVPSRGYVYHDRKDRWTAIYHGFDGAHGTLSILDGPLDATRRPELRTIAPDVGYYRTAFLDFVLPGIIYLAELDPERNVGLLEYRNLELGFTAQIASGVADFIVTADDVLYSVPYGDAAGIWLLQAK